MKNYLFTTTLLLWCSFLWAQKITYVSKHFPASTVNRVDVQTIGGQIQVEGSNAGKASVEVILSPNGKQLTKSEKDLKRLFDKEYDLEVDVKNGVLMAKAKRKTSQRSGNHPVSVSFKITVPHHITSQLQTSGGGITLSNLTGNQNFRTSGGSLKLAHLSGQVDGKTSGGSIHATDCEGDITLNTSGGSINLQKIQGQLTVKTSGGSITGSDISGTLSARTSGGSIKLTNCEGGVQASTSGGSITASLKKVSAPLALKTSAGSIHITVPKDGYDVDLRGSRVNRPSSDFLGTATRKAVKAKLNGGGKAIQASTSAGSVNLSWR